MDAIVRRGHLTTAANPNSRTDYIVALSGKIGALYTVDIRYIPDEAILIPDSLATYLGTLATVQWPHLEALAASIVSDVNNELVPRWVQITVSGISAGMSHRVTLEDRQPRWDNPVLLSRIASV